MLLCAMAQPVVVPLAPGVDFARPGQGYRELGATIDFDHSQVTQLLNNPE